MYYNMQSIENVFLIYSDKIKSKKRKNTRRVIVIEVFLK